MALSLVCKDCNAQLKSVKEAQEHNELTGHANFEESTEAVLNLVCVACGKPCRSQVEKDLHTKRTGHIDFVDKTKEAAIVNTEVEMKAASAELRAELKGESMAVDTEEPQEPSVEGGSTQDGEVEEKVEPEVDQGALAELEAMGFSHHRSVRALHFTGSSDIEQAVNWIVEHEGEPDLDQPLLLPKQAADNTPKLTPEEARLKAAELVHRAKLRREADEREAERLREKERIRAGKELLAAQRQEEELRVKRILEQRMREKEEDRKAREKLRVKLEEDRRERRRKLGLPEELTEAEKEAERKKAAEKAAAEAKKAALPVKPITVASQLRDILVGIKKNNPGANDRVNTCFTTLLKMLANVAQKPGEDKFRKIRLSNPAIHTRVSSVPGAVDFLVKCGFKKDGTGEFLEMASENVNVELLNLAGAELNNALTNPFFGAL